MQLKLILVCGLFSHVSPSRLYTGERSKKRETSFIVSIDKQELELLVLTVGTIREDYIVLGSVWQIIKLSSMLYERPYSLKKTNQTKQTPPPPKIEQQKNHPPNKQQTTTTPRNKQHQKIAMPSPQNPTQYDPNLYTG